MFSHLQFVPLVVEVCTRIVEERGIENQGVYRVPGNTGAVNFLQGEFDKVGAWLSKLQKSPASCNILMVVNCLRLVQRGLHMSMTGSQNMV